MKQCMCLGSCVCNEDKKKTHPCPCKDQASQSDIVSNAALPCTHIKTCDLLKLSPTWNERERMNQSRSFKPHPLFGRIHTSKSPQEITRSLQETTYSGDVLVGSFHRCLVLSAFHAPPLPAGICGNRNLPAMCMCHRATEMFLMMRLLSFEHNKCFKGVSWEVRLPGTALVRAKRDTRCPDLGVNTSLLIIVVH